MTIQPKRADAPLRLAESLNVSIVIPTLNESANLPALLRRIHGSMLDQSYEVIVVDDHSTDDTLEVCKELATRYPVRLIDRATPVGGLSGAVIRGLESAHGDILIVMDADLQHPPESIPTLIGAIEFGADFALGSRYVIGGCTEQNWGRWREWNSNFATLLAKPIAGKVRDPMSGFFAITRRKFGKAQSLNPIGYKIALELLCKCRIRRLMEVPILFGCRQAGESKLTWNQRMQFLRHLARLYAFRFPKTALLFKSAVAAGMAIGFSAMADWSMTPIVTTWAVVATVYATRSNRPQSKPMGTVVEDREVELRSEQAAITLAA